MIRNHHFRLHAILFLYVAILWVGSLNRCPEPQEKPLMESIISVDPTLPTGAPQIPSNIFASVSPYSMSVNLQRQRS